MKHIYDANWVGKSRNPHDFMKKRKNELEGQYGGTWTWYTAHGKNVLIPIIDFTYLKLDWDVFQYQNVVKPFLLEHHSRNLIQLFYDTDLSIPELTYACAYLIKEEGYRFDTCRTGDAVDIYKLTS